MCGIAGIFNLGEGPTPDPRLLKRMVTRLTHRGPDDEGVYTDPGVGLGMRRLSVIDVAGGKQPYRNEDRSVIVVFNGEIYNYRDLAAELEDRGHRLASGADGEVIAHLYEEYGSAFPEKLDGMFAIALYDATRRRMLLTRDRVGIKPLFLWSSSHRVVFASEIKALLEDDSVPREVDPDALLELLTWEYIPAPRTLLRTVSKCEPATLLEFDLDSGRRSARRYWQPRVEKSVIRSRGEWLEALSSQLDLAVERQLISDVPLGAFLSGGVDSSLVASAMNPRGSSRHDAFTIRFDEAGYDESRWAAMVAEHLGIEHHLRTLDPEIATLTDTVLESMDDPIGDFSIFPTFLISQMAREEVTVALSGDGGDELFGGYETYVAQSLSTAWERFPAPARRPIEHALGALRPRAQKKGVLNKARRFAEGLSYPSSLGHARWRAFLTRHQREALLTPDLQAALERDPFSHIGEILERAPESLGPLERGLWVDFHSYLPDNCLVKVDRMSMLSSLEVRVPLLDTELIELAFSLPEALKVSGTHTKTLLKELAAQRVPREAVYRSKEGFSMPMKQWLNTSLAQRLDDELSSATIEGQGLFRAETIARLISQHRANVANHSHLLWTLLVFQDWRRRWGV